MMWRLIVAGFCIAAAALAAAQQTPARFGGAYADLDARRQRLIDDWVGRFNDLTKQKVEPGPFYDTFLKLSTKTTFDAITHALMTTALTDGSGGSLGDALDLIEHVESVRGEAAGAPGDRQFRMYVRLKTSARDTLARSQQFQRGVDNSVYHKGYPINYRQQGGVPSIQVSLARDSRRADVDVDYRSSAFPAAMFNGHLSAANSDVRAGNNPDRHANRWTGFQNWWRGFFGIRMDSDPDVPGRGDKPGSHEPRAGRKTIDVMAHDFLTAWLVEGDVMAAANYVSERAYECLALNEEDPAGFDRGMAPVRMLMTLRAAKEALGPRASLDGLVVGVRLAMPELKVVTQPHHARFVLYAVPDDVAVKFDCGSRLSPGNASNARRRYGNYFGATFYMNGQQNHPIALLWARENGYWKITSWQAEADEDRTPPPEPPPAPPAVRIKADASFVEAAREFLESWLIRKNYDQAFQAFSTRSYPCYNLERAPNSPAATSPEEAAQRLRLAIENIGKQAGQARTLDALIESVQPNHEAVRVMDHPFSRTFAPSSLPTVFAQAADCSTRASDARFTGEPPFEYGEAFGMNFRFRTRGGEAPVLRFLWVRENGAWRITAFSVELP